MTYNFTIRPAFDGKKPFAWALVSDQIPEGVAGTSGRRDLAEKAISEWKTRWTKSGQTGFRSEVAEGR